MLKVTRILSLGPLEIRDGEENSVHGILTQPKRAALLVYLAAARPRGYHRRDHLLALFWPELDDAHARPALNQALTYLRRELGPGAIVSRGPQDVAINPDLVACDVPAFETALERSDWATALELYRGDFLAGFHISEADGFADWADRARDRLRREAARAAGAQADRAAAEGNLTGAIEAARRALELEPFHEPSLRRLMQLLDESGDRAAATLAFESFRNRLREELGVGPAPESEALFQLIRSRATPRSDSSERRSVDLPPRHDREQPPGEPNGVLPSTIVDESAVASRKRPRVGAAGLAAFLVVVVAAVYLVAMRSSDAAPGLGAAGEQRFITALDGYEAQPALSANGDMVAFTWAAIGARTRRIMVMPVAGGAARALTDGVHDDSQPTWSPDGRVAFLRQEAGDSTFAIMVTPVIGGGAPQKLMSTRSSDGLDWSPTGEFLAYVDRPDAQTLERIFLLTLADGAKRQLTQDIGTGLEYHVHPAFSADGRTIAFLSVPINSGAGGAVYTQAIDGGASVRRSDYNWAWDVDWAPGDRQLILATGDHSSRYLVAIPLSGSAPVRLSGGRDAVHVATSASSRAIVYAEVLRDHDIVQIPGPLSSEGGSQLLIRSSRDDLAPSYSPDGSRIAYVSAESGAWELWVANADGSGKRTLTDFGHAQFPEWSPDSRSIVFSSVRADMPGSLSDVFIVDAEGGIPRNITFDERRDANPTWSHDGRWIYYQSRSDSTNWQLWRKSPEGGPGEFVLGTRGPILRPRSAANGDVYYYSPREDRDLAGWVWRLPADGSNPEPLVAVSDFAGWTVWDNKVVHRVERDSLTTVEMFDPLTGTTTLLASMPSVLQLPTPESEFFDRALPMLDVSNDGQWIALVVSKRAGSDLVLWKGPWQD